MAKAVYHVRLLLERGATSIVAQADGLAGICDYASKIMRVVDGFTAAEIWQGPHKLATLHRENVPGHADAAPYPGFAPMDI